MHVLEQAQQKPEHVMRMHAHVFEHMQAQTEAHAQAAHSYAVCGMRAS
jgi:hypothetical protein